MFCSGGRNVCSISCSDYLSSRYSSVIIIRICPVHEICWFYCFQHIQVKTYAQGSNTCIAILSKYSNFTHRFSFKFFRHKHTFYQKNHSKSQSIKKLHFFLPVTSHIATKYCVGRVGSMSMRIFNERKQKYYLKHFQINLLFQCHVVYSWNRLATCTIKFLFHKFYFY